jgi:pyruvate formate lyase activating enzyme
MSSLANVLDSLTVEGELYEKLEDNSLRCFACGHRCLIREGKRGICQVRFNKGGKLLVPHGYVAALQSDPIEKKPFSHVLPGANALTFGMLGCDYHCSYCFTGDTMVVTDRGLISMQDAFELGEAHHRELDGEISFPTGLKAVTSSGELRNVKGVFRHPYLGELVRITPFYLPAIRCTPDHRVYVLDDQSSKPYMIQAKNLNEDHYLVVPRKFHFSSEETVDAMEYLRHCIATGKLILSRQIAPAVVNEGGYPQRYNSVDWHEVERFEHEFVSAQNFYLIPLHGIERESFSGDVFNMEVEGEHNYLAGFFLVSNCQNWLTSQAMRDPASDASAQFIRKMTPQKMVEYARSTNASVVVSSYNEPLITSEWAVEIFKAAKANGLTCAYVSNGNNTPEVMDYIAPYLSAYKVDLKCMNDKNYRKLGGTLQHTLDGIQRAREAGLWVEVVTLVIPGFNDSNEELWEAARFLAGLSVDIPWHVTAFHKDYKMTDPDNTDAKTLIRAAEIGKEAGLKYVYAGNLPGMVGEYENTFCPACNHRLVKRRGYVLEEYRITGKGTCPRCGEKVAGLWHKDPSQARLNGIGHPLPVW